MAEFSPYSITRGGFSTPREMFMSIVKDLTQYRPSGNPFTIEYPRGLSDLSDPSVDVVVIQATSHVDPCVDDPINEQPWVIRFDTRGEIGHGMGHINITTPLQIDFGQEGAPAIPYIPPNTTFDPNEINTKGTLGFIGARMLHGTSSNPESNKYGFINRSIYHTRVMDIQQLDDYGNLKWNLHNISDGELAHNLWGSRRVQPLPAYDEQGKAEYRVTLQWIELMNPGEIDTSKVFPEEPTTTNNNPHIGEVGFASPIYEQRSCTLYFKDLPGLGGTNLNNLVFTTYKVEGDVPPSILEGALKDTVRDEAGTAQQIEFVYAKQYPELVEYEIFVAQAGSPFAYNYQSSWRVKEYASDNLNPFKWHTEELKVTDINDLLSGNKVSENKGLEYYDNLKFDLAPESEKSFDHKGEALEPRLGAQNVPMSYALTVSAHGIVLATWDQAVDQYDTGEGHRFSWFSTQRLVDKDTGEPLVNQNESFCPLYCMYGVYHEKLSKSMYFVVRESDIHRPSEEQTAGEDSPDSNAVLNTFEQVAVSEDYEYVITVPSGLTTQRYLYLEEADLIGYTSADVISNGALSEFSMYDEGTCSVTGHTTEAECVAGNGTWTETSRLYKGLPSTGKFNTGMRVLMRWYGGRLGSEKPQPLA
ncbi:hypothetical protein CWB96_00290 [Pseudoalteromonas citrea]|uniref:Uncharacterized protein n=1 Tax=Pseudoalteromonas citrea TaxID=43655 RepID=A0A5S3XXB6_9GAMM|nr:hypothetical protein [Pseudoalteromonas citrea]TMP46305.1 hypothetical protein CWB97_02285 [Pseudoalteromonas citrea]TMP63081.1 hypothetical protein CWB96_00290 [Pseudoalteromonas citrea]